MAPEPPPPAYVTPHEACCLQGGRPLSTPDLSQDWSIDGSDLLIVVGKWGPCGECCAGDINRDGQVDIDELLLVLGWYGADPASWSWCE